jgi:hypothetical protein
MNNQNHTPRELTFSQADNKKDKVYWKVICEKK